MRIYADLRCLQDENFAFRGVGYHSSVLLKNARPYFSRSVEVVGFVDPEMADLPSEYAALVDRVETVFAAPPSDCGVFIEFSPMTHSPEKVARLLGRPNLFSCAVVYDFIPLDVSDRYLATNDSRDEYLSQLNWLAAYEHYFPISKYSADRLQQVLPVPSSQVSVAGVALRPAFELAFHGHDSAYEPVQGVRGRYILFVGGADARKNVEVLLQSHSQLRTSLPDVQLIVVGKYPEAHAEYLRKIYEAMGGERSRLVFCHGVSDSQLAWLYRNALCTVCSSHIEGFSLPIIEAPACGCPLLASINDAHCELLGASEALFKPNDHNALVGLIQRVATDERFRIQLLKSQKRVPQRFTAAEVSDRFWLPIAEGLRNRGRAADVGNSNVRQSGRPRIAIISPFPPDQSGVAEYTRRTVQALGRIADVDVFTDARDPLPTPEVNRFHPISDWPYISGQYDEVLTVIGNSHFHTKIIDLQKKYGGPCLIHDNRLAELYNWWKGPDYFREMSCKSLGRQVSMSECQSWIADPGKLPSVFFDEMIPNSRPLIVHSRGIQAQCRKQYAVETSYLPFCCYRDFAAADLTPAARQQARMKLGIPGDQVVVISLGIIGPTKAPDKCIQAIARLRDEGVNAHLYFVGSPSGMEADLHAWAREYGVADRLHLTGDWVSEETYYQYVQAADFAVQLRNHFFGGLSGAMLDCIGSGLVTVANDDLAEALESPETVLRVSDDLSGEEVASQFLSAYRANMQRLRLRPSREAYLQDHSFERYAIKLLEVLGLRGRTEVNIPSRPTAGTEAVIASQPEGIAWENKLTSAALQQRLDVVVAALQVRDSVSIQSPVALIEHIRRDEWPVGRACIVLYQLFLGRIPSAAEMLNFAKFYEYESTSAIAQRFLDSSEFNNGRQVNIRFAPLDTDTLAVDVTHTLTYPYNTGIQRVVRSLGRQLEIQQADYRLIRFNETIGNFQYVDDIAANDLTNWEKRDRRPAFMPSEARRKSLKKWARKLVGDKVSNSIRDKLREWKKRRKAKIHRPSHVHGAENTVVVFLWDNQLFFPEVIMDLPRLGAVNQLLQHLPLTSTMIVYDLMPVLHPDLFEGNVDGFVRYLTLLRVVDRVSCISRSVLEDVERFLGHASHRRTDVLTEYHYLGGDFDFNDVREGESLCDQPTVLCVGTLEVRKNHRRILRGMVKAQERGARFKGVFVGNPGWMCDEFLEEVAFYQARGIEVEVRMSASEADLRKLYSRASFSIFCSLAEGFGLPIVESLAKGVPCITSDRGSMKEIAEVFGGCVVVDPESEIQIADAISHLINNPQAYQSLKEQIRQSENKSWAQYARELFEFANKKTGDGNDAHSHSAAA